VPRWGLFNPPPNPKTGDIMAAAASRSVTSSPVLSRSNGLLSPAGLGRLLTTKGMRQSAFLREVQGLLEAGKDAHACPPCLMTLNPCLGEVGALVVPRDSLRMPGVGGFQVGASGWDRIAIVAPLLYEPDPQDRFVLFVPKPVSASAAIKKGPTLEDVLSSHVAETFFAAATQSR